MCSKESGMESNRTFISIYPYRFDAISQARVEQNVDRNNVEQNIDRNRAKRTVPIVPQLAGRDAGKLAGGVPSPHTAAF
jgi:hypothetical protein